MSYIDFYILTNVFCFLISSFYFSIWRKSYWLSLVSTSFGFSSMFLECSSNHSNEAEIIFEIYFCKKDFYILEYWTSICNTVSSTDMFYVLLFCCDNSLNLFILPIFNSILAIIRSSYLHIFVCLLIFFLQQIILNPFHFFMQILPINLCFSIR